MVYSEKHMDLFSINDNQADPYCLAHCISSDFGMGGGIALGFNEHFNMKNILMETYGTVKRKFIRDGAFAIPIEAEDLMTGDKVVVYNLITKKLVYEKPTYKTLMKALISMRDQMKQAGYKKLAMPKIGCGIDSLEWENVKKLIQGVFSDEDMEIVICIK